MCLPFATISLYIPLISTALALPPDLSSLICYICRHPVDTLSLLCLSFPFVRIPIFEPISRMCSLPEIISFRLIIYVFYLRRSPILIFFIDRAVCLYPSGHCLICCNFNRVLFFFAYKLSSPPDTILSCIYFARIPASHCHPPRPTRVRSHQRNSSRKTMPILGE